MPYMWISSHTFLANWIVNQPVVNQDPDVILQGKKYIIQIRMLQIIKHVYKKSFPSDGNFTKWTSFFVLYFFLTEHPQNLL